MAKKLFKTLFENSKYTIYPELDGYNSKKNTNKTFSIAFAYIFYKRIKNSEPSDTDLSKFLEDYKYDLKLEHFNQSTAYRNDLLPHLKNDEFEYDFLILKNWQDKINSNKKVLLKELIEKIDLKDENYMYLIDLVNKDIEYCDFFKKIYDSILKFKINEELDKIYNFLDIDFDLIRNFLRENNINISIQANKEITKNHLISDSSLIPAVQDLSIFELIEEYWQTIEISSNDKTYTLEGNYKEDFLSLIKSNKKNLYLLKGKEGSGKGFISLYYSFGALENDFLVKFVSIQENSSIENIKSELNKFLNTYPDKKYFIVIDSISNLDINSKSTQKVGHIRKFIDYLANICLDNPDIYILLTINHERSIYNNIFDKNIKSEFNEFYINEIKTEPDWIKTIMEKVVFDDYRGQIESSLNLYHRYLIRMIEKNSRNLERNELESLIGKIAYCSLIGNPKLKDFIYEFKLNDKDIDFLSYNPICKTDKNNMEIITFNHEIFKYILGAEYILNNIDSITRFWKNNKFKDDKWKVLFIYLSKRLDDSNIDIFLKSPLLLRGIIFHLRRDRNLEEAEKFINYIKDEDMQNNEKSYITLEKSKKYYGKYGDYISCLKELSNINNPNYELELYYEYIIQITSCTLDLFLPISTIKLINQYLENNSIENDPRIYGNLSRAYLRNGDYIKSEEYLIKKLETHNKNNSLSDSIRDKVDLILIKAFQFSKDFSLNLFHESLDLSKEILEYYNNLEKKELIKNSDKKAYIYKNLSYFLPNLGKNKSEELIEIIQIDESIKDKAPLGIIFINFSIYYFNQSDLSKAVNYLTKAIEYLNTYEVELSFAYYLNYKITNEKESRERSLKHYNNFIKNVDFVRNWLINNTNLTQEEKVSIKFEDYNTKKLSLIDFKIF
ncbi:MAG: hypothetical protein U0354_15445 [Candidatus Sericytochromatia bacterium]